MDTREKLIDARIGMLALADELKNISRACQLAGISRTHYYDIKEAFERYGRDGLAPTVRRRPRMPNETPSELVARILDMTAEYPTYSYVRISQQLRLVGVPASAAQVRGVWAREGLLKRFDRLLWLERRMAEHGGPLTESEMKLLRQHARQTLDPQGQIEVPRPAISAVRTPTTWARSRGSAGSMPRPSSMPMPPWALPSSISARCR
jgi:hypothetical protein